MVKSDHHNTTRISIFLPPNLSPSHPVGISNAAYAMVNIPKIQPHCTVEIFNSLMILELADDNAILSKKVIMDNMDKTVSTWYLFFIRSLRVLQYNQLETNSLYRIIRDIMRYLFPISKREQSNFHIVMYHLLPSLFLKGGKSYILITHY